MTSIHSLQCLHCLLQQVLIEHFFLVFPCNAVIACYIGCSDIAFFIFGQDKIKLSFLLQRSLSGLMPVILQLSGWDGGGGIMTAILS